MKQFFIDFFKGQQEKFKTPFFSSLLIAIVICYCDVIYYILFEDEKASLKIISAKAMVDDKNIYFPFFLSAVFLIIPIFVNYLYQILLDKFIYKCKENKANLELNISDAQYKLKLNNAKEKYADEKVKIEHAEKIESIKLSLKTKGIRINELESNVVDRELIISQKDELITAITSTLDNAKKQLEHTEVQLDETQKKLIEIRKKLDLSIIEGKRFSDMNATLRRKILNFQIE
ncbi:hypothetical protein [Shewanella marina]|uniref:hypothetical protein n=1 Tax=Shewanella marina TaxID=487319 RepID=UPI000472C479|nr:hypothetical protein [Shewanella marina]